MRPGPTSDRKARVLLVDLDRSATNGAEVRSVLDGSQDIELVCSDLAPPADLKEFQDLVIDARPHAVYLVLPAEPFAQIPWLGSLDAATLGSPVFVVTQDEHPTHVFDLLALGVTDFTLAPLCPVELLPRLWRCLEHLRPDVQSTQRLKQRVQLKRLVGESECLQKVVRKIPVVAGCNATVLLCGETGTGKDVIARSIHYLGPRSGGPFVPVNCAAIPTELVESELFGHEPAAFTGATVRRTGLVEESDQGTLFLDEVDSLPQVAQVKVLRFLQDREFRRLGSNQVRSSDTRLIAATNAPIDEALRCGRLREDLYYRLNVVRLTLPPLRERLEDIPLLAHHFLKHYSRSMARPLVGFTEEAMARLLLYEWPGNVRELEHAVERAVVLSENRLLVEKDDLDLPRPSPESEPASFVEARAIVLSKFERGYLERILAAHRGNISRAAREAKRSRRGFWELIRKHHIDVARFRRLDVAPVGEPRRTLNRASDEML